MKRLLDGVKVLDFTWAIAGPSTTKFLADHGVTGIFQEDNAKGPGDLSELRSYVSAKMLWDPTNDPEALITSFIDGYYGAKAAPHMREYIDIVHESAKTQSRPVFSVFADGINAPFLTADVVLRSAAALSAARRAATPTGGRRRPTLTPAAPSRSRCACAHVEKGRARGRRATGSGAPRACSARGSWRASREWSSRAGR